MDTLQDNMKDLIIVDDKESLESKKTPSTKKEKKSVTKPAQEFKSTETGVCSSFLIEVEKGRKAYRYDVDMMNVARNKSLTKGADDGQRALNKNICYELLTAVYQKTDGLYGLAEAGGELVYDCKTTMYTSVQINMQDPLNPMLLENLTPNDVNDYVRQYCGETAQFQVKITPNAEVPILDISCCRQYTSKESLFNEDRSMRTFLEMAISQCAINSNIYTPVGPGRLFEASDDNSEQVENGIVLRMGVAKGVRVVKNDGNPMPALVLDAKMCPFFQPQNLSVTVRAICRPNGPRTPLDWDRVRRLLQDVRVELTYASHRSFGIGRFGDRPMSQQIVLVDGERMPMPEFYRRRYGIDLEYANWPAVSANTPAPRGKKQELFPIELLQIMEDQRVPLEKMSKDLSNKLLKYNTIPPEERLQKIMRHAHALGAFDQDNAVLRAFGITVIESSNKVMISVRHLPQILFANNVVVQPDPTRAEWRRTTGRYLITREISNWVVLCEPVQKPIVSRFIAMFIERAKAKDMKFASSPDIVLYTDRQWEEAFVRCIDHRDVEFVMLIDSRLEDSHGRLKYYEARYKILTQHVTVERVADVVNLGKIQTLDNIINKTNCKNFGLNYKPVIEKLAEKYDLERNQVLVIGLDVAHPPPVSAQERRLLRAKGMTVESLDPSVVGVSANMASDPHIFVGDYFYQETRREAIDMRELRERTIWILDMLEENRPAAARPKYIFILRDGLSEGQFSMAVNEELGAIRDGCAEKYGEGYHPKFIVVIGTKRHFKRFFTFRNGAFKNLDPGSVIDTKFVREDVPEFFMQSHYPLKGVGKPVQYSVPIDEIGMSQDELQAFLNALAYSHQIVYSAVSLPEPIFQSDELAKRGSNNFKTMKLIDGHSVPRLPNKVVDAHGLTMMLSYMHSRLQATRFTA